MALTDREVGSLVDFMQRTLVRVQARGMPEMDEEIKWWIRKGTAELQLRLGQPVVDPGPQPPVIKN
jgi:hypothetical protein